jgi:hypothetical protein
MLPTGRCKYVSSTYTAALLHSGFSSYMSYLEGLVSPARVLLAEQFTVPRRSRSTADCLPGVRYTIQLRAVCNAQPEKYQIITDNASTHS